MPGREVLVTMTCVYCTKGHAIGANNFTFTANHPKDFEWNLNNMVRKKVHEIWKGLVNVVDKLEQPK